MPLSNARNAERNRQRRAAAAAAAAASPPDRVPRPRGRIPRDHEWDATPPGCYRHVDTGAPYDRRAARSTAHATGARARRNRRPFAARCHDALFKPGFSVDVARDDCGRLGDATCCYCQALLYADEAVAVKGRGDVRARGRHCCAEGQVELPPTKRHAPIDELWSRRRDRAAAAIARAATATCCYCDVRRGRGRRRQSQRSQA